MFSFGGKSQCAGYWDQTALFTSVSVSLDFFAAVGY
jgi:hypothetical protein